MRYTVNTEDKIISVLSNISEFELRGLQRDYVGYLFSIDIKYLPANFVFNRADNIEVENQ